jgi:predicted transcriptional regulator
MNPDSPALTKAIRRALKKIEDGMTIRELEEVTGRKYANISSTVRQMPDVYIDRWQQPLKRGGGYAAVYVLVKVPENCPKPQKEE